MGIALCQPQHILHLDVLQVLLHNRLSLLLVVAWGQARVQQLLGVLPLRAILGSQVQHSARADSLRHTELLLGRVATMLLHLLHSLQVLLLLLHTVLLARFARLVMVMLIL